MKITSSYAVEVRGVNKYFRVISRIYQDALSYCINLFDGYWITYLEIMSKNERRPFCEKLIHSTKTNKAICDFDERFPKLPSYLRRAVINQAIGHLDSYHSLIANWEISGKKGNKPTLSTRLNKLPVFYNRDMFRNEGEENHIRLKLFYDNDWKWLDVKLKPTDCKYIEKHCNMEHMSSPILERKNKKWFLRFSFEDNINLNDIPLNERRILAVDMGINIDAACSVMTADGTILARKFIDFASDKDYLYHTLGKIKKVSRQQGSHNTSKLWRIARFRNEELSKKISKAIVGYAKEQGCSVIVMEYLDMKGKIRGKAKQKLHLWRKKDIQHRIEHKAHKENIRISHVNAKYTSQLAFDGSGKVIRGKEAGYSTYELCKFQSGKEYNCDLNASYNIGARYFIREILKNLSVRNRSDMEAKVPSCQKRCKNTLYTLKQMIA